LRVLAKVIDWIIVFAGMLIVQIVVLAGITAGTDTTSGSTNVYSTNSSLGVNLALTLVIVVLRLGLDTLYNVGFVTWWGGTPGKLIVGQRIVRSDGSRVTAVWALRRWSLNLGLSSANRCAGLLTKTKPVCRTGCRCQHPVQVLHQHDLRRSRRLLGSALKRTVPVCANSSGLTSSQVSV
jgi:hypothetical protein